MYATTSGTIHYNVCLILTGREDFIKVTLLTCVPLFPPVLVHDRAEGERSKPEKGVPATRAALPLTALGKRDL